MSRGVNKVILVGNLGNDPDMRSTPSGTSVAHVSLATRFSIKDKQTGEWREETEWHRVVFFDRLAEVAKQYLHKGSQIYVEGSLRTNKWQDKNTGQDRYSTEIIARDMQMLGSRNESGGTRYGAPGSYGASSGGYAPVAPAQGAGQAPAQPYTQQAGGQPVPPPAYPNQNTGQPIPPQPPITGTTTPPNDKNFDEDVPF